MSAPAFDPTARPPIFELGQPGRANRYLDEGKPLQSFLPAIAVAAGFRVGEFPVRHHARTRGEAHFGLRQLWWKPALAMLRLRPILRTLRKPAPSPGPTR